MLSYDDDYFGNLYHGTSLDDPANYGGESPFQPETIRIHDDTMGDTYSYADTEIGREAARSRLDAMGQSFHVASANSLAAQRLGVISGTYGATMPTMQGPHQGINLDDIPSYDLGSYIDASDDDDSGAPPTREPEQELPPPPQLVATPALQTVQAVEPTPAMTKRRGALIDNPTPTMKKKRTF